MLNKAQLLGPVRLMPKKREHGADRMKERRRMMAGMEVPRSGQGVLTESQVRSAWLSAGPFMGRADAEEL